MNQQSVQNVLPALSGNLVQSLFGGFKIGASAAPNPLVSGMFTTQLEARLKAIAAKNALSAPGPSGVPSSTALQTQALAKKIAEQLKAGVSLADITTQLAASLATSVAALLAVGDAARTQLQAVFASALAPPGQTGPPSQSTADQAQTLAQRFAQVASTATRVATNGESGQLNRFVGNILDANAAKEIPAQAPTARAPLIGTASGVASQAGASIAGAAPSVSDAALTRAFALAQAQFTAPSSPPFSTNPLTLAAAAASDGKTVLAQSSAISSGGSTLLGRVLTRAANVAQPNQPVLASSDSGTDSSSSAGQLIPRSITDPTVASFLKSFESAFATHAAPGELLKRAASADGSALLLAPTSSSTNDASAFVPGVTALRSDPSTQAANVAQPPPAHPAPEASQSAIVDQILRGAFTKNLGQSSEIRLSLVPENLGDVSVKLTVNNGGTVDAHVIAQTTDVRDALVAGQTQLTKQLADAGLKLTSFTVDVNSGGFAGFTQQQQSSAQQRQSTGRRTLLGGIESDGGGEEPSLQAVPSFGPPLVAGQNFGALNYLV